MTIPHKDIYDVCVIGAGSGGLSVAAVTSQLGLKTALIEKGKMGGDCLNTGCVPSKALLEAAKAAQNFQTAGTFGIAPQEPAIRFEAVKDHVNEVIKTIEPHDSQERFEALGVTVIRDTARFVSGDMVQAGNRTIKAHKFVIAAGARAAIPPISGLDKDKIFTNENIFDLRERPEHLVIIGGGPIGIEMAQAHRRLGSQVTVIDMATILPNDDPQLVAIIRRQLEKEGITLHENTSIRTVEHGDGTVRLHADDNNNSVRVDGSHLLVATGRQPNTETLALDLAGVAYGKKGIIVDERLRTSNKHIYAIGDIAGGPQFTHVAGYHAGIVIRNMAFKIPAKVDYSALPWVTYTEPELANVGLTEKMALDKYGSAAIRTLSLPLSKNDRAQTAHGTDGLIKVTAKKNGEILGVAIAAPHAGELIGLWGLAIAKGHKLKDITGLILPYPTLGEIGKSVAGEWYKPALFSDKTRRLVSILKKLPF